jgi:hypothetical protein
MMTSAASLLAISEEILCAKSSPPPIALTSKNTFGFDKNRDSRS